MVDACWFTTAYDYSGPAKVVFEDPHAEFFGPASVGPDENGQPSVEITVEHSVPAIQDGFDLAAIQLGSKTLPDGVRMIGFGGGAPNRAGVTVQTKEGVFETAPSWEYRFSDLSPDTPLTLRLTPMKSEYRVDNLAREKFMVLPLSGFTSEFPKPSTVLSGHPLHIQGAEDSSAAGCIPFGVNGELAFIQQLPGAGEGGKGTKPWSGETVLTAVAVVPIADPAITDFRGWFLNVFLRLLDLATGSAVGTPWIEVRDENGRLVRRLHLAINQSKRSSDGYAALDTIHWQNGEFLTSALSSAEAKEPFFSIALRHCCRAGVKGLSIEDQLAHIVRALECLCARYGFSKQELTDGLATELNNGIRSVLDGARAEIRKLASTVGSPGRDQIERIAERARSAAQTDRSFGLAVKGLLSNFGLSDCDVLEPYFKSNPGPGGRGWVESLSYYRGAIFHEGYIDFDAPGMPVGEVFGFVFHLHDLLVRVLLKIIGYRGIYQPRSIRGAAAETADWFRPGVNVDAVFRVPTLGIK
jgi:hypothetical protein